MAQMSVDGLDSLIDAMAILAAIPGSVVADMLNAEADVVVQAQRSEIESKWKGPYSTGISTNSIKKGKVKKTPDGGAISIYPQGTRKRGKKKIRNGEIAFINEYGAPQRGIAARPAISTATAKSEEQAVGAGEKVYNAYLDSKNL